MDTITEDRLLGVAIAALLAALGGELIGSQLLVTAGVAAFALSLTALFAVMSVVLAVGVSRDADLTALDPAATERGR